MSNPRTRPPSDSPASGAFESNGAWARRSRLPMAVAVLALVVKVVLMAGVVIALLPPAAAAEPPGTWVVDRAWRSSAPPAAAVEVDWPDRLPARDTTYTIHFRIEATPAAAADRPRALRLGPGCADLTLHLDGQPLWRTPPAAPSAVPRCRPAMLVALPSTWLTPGPHTLTVNVAGAGRTTPLPLPSLALGWHEALDAAERQRATWAAAPAAAGAALLLLAGSVGLGMAWRTRAVEGPVRGTATAPPGSALVVASTAAPLAALGVASIVGAALALAPLVGEPSLTGRPAAVPMLVALALALGAGAWGLHRGPGATLSGRQRLLAAAAALTALAGVGGRTVAASAGTPVGAWPEAALLLCAITTAALLVGLALNQQRARQEALKTQSWLDQRIRDATAEIERNFRQLAELRVEQVTERERKRIAGDLHDDLGAKLLTIVHTSESERISTLAREALEEMRLSVRGLTGRPVLLHDALGDWRVEVVSRLSQAGIECGWSAPDDPEASPRLSSRAYVQTTRILRESTSNIIKHSGASRVEVRCTVADGDFQLVIQDNGNGIAADVEHRIDRGHGLASMKSRAKQLQGQCLVESAPGYGTVIRLTIPMDRATEGRPSPG